MKCKATRIILSARESLIGTRYNSAAHPSEDLNHDVRPGVQNPPGGPLMERWERREGDGALNWVWSENSSLGVGQGTSILWRLVVREIG